MNEINHDSNSCNFCCTKITNINLNYNNTSILKDINFHVHCGEILTIIGPNGAGKTSLLKCILKEIHTSGNISFKSKHSLKNKINIGYVPQKLEVSSTNSSVYDFIASYISTTPVFLYKSKKLFNEILLKLKELDSQDLISKNMSDLSGGELQKILLAVACTPYPELLILDEFSSGLDLKTKESFFNLLLKIKKEQDIAIIMVCHDLDYVRRYSDRVILLNKTILQEGTYEQVSKSKDFIELFG